MRADGGCQTSKTYLDSQIGPPTDLPRLLHRGGPARQRGQDRQPDGQRVGRPQLLHRQPRPGLGAHLGRSSIGPGGANGYYDIVGFGAIVFTGDNEHAKWLEGAAVADACKPGTEVPGTEFCSEPGGAFIIDVTGEVQLVR